MTDPTEASSVDWTDGLGLARVRHDGAPVVVLRRDGAAEARIALVGGRSFDDLPALLEAAQGNVAAIEAGTAIEAPDELLLSPVGRPGKVICLGQNYLAHAQESGNAGSAHPDLFPKWHTSLTGPYSDVALPAESDQIDFESEFAFVIGARARRVAAEDAESVVFGYTVANDVSVRDYQFHCAGRIAGKAWDGLTPVGPVVVPAAQLGGARPDLAIRGILDGEVVQDARTSSLLFSMPELVAYISTVMTLEPGDLILTGTPAGIGFVREPKLLLRHGSEFEVYVEGIGTLRNRFVDEKAG